MLLFPLGTTAAVYPFLLPLSVPFGLVIWRVASQDLTRMRAGEMDPRGEKEVRMARASAQVAVFAPLAGLVIWAAILAGVQLLQSWIEP
jgi:hypothetical protein